LHVLEHRATAGSDGPRVAEEDRERGGEGQAGHANDSDEGGEPGDLLRHRGLRRGSDRPWTTQAQAMFLRPSWPGQISGDVVSRVVVITRQRPTISPAPMPTRNAPHRAVSTGPSASSPWAWSSCPWVSPESSGPWASPARSPGWWTSPVPCASSSG